MIWIDSSFAIEWLLGNSRVSTVVLRPQEAAILAAQYVEILVFFAKKLPDLTIVSEQLDALTLDHPNSTELKQAAHFYSQARKRKSKLSVADAILAAVAITRNETILSFDQDFAEVGLKFKEGIWS